MKQCSDPKISVILSIYKEPIAWIEKSVNSILNQTFSDFELIIINDYPLRSENRALIESFKQKDTRIVYIENKKNIGLTASLNIGLKTAKGKYIARMDADDISIPERFQIQYDFMENNTDVLLCGANAYLIDENDKVIGTLKYPELNKQIKETLVLKNCLAHPTFFYRFDVIDKYNLNYSEEYPYAEDYEFLTQVIKCGKLYNFQKELLFYRKSSTQIGQAKINEQKETTNKIRNEYIKYLIKDKYDISLDKKYFYERVVSLIKKNPKDKILINTRLSCIIYLENRNIIDRIAAVLSFDYSFLNSIRIILNK